MVPVCLPNPAIGRLVSRSLRSPGGTNVEHIAPGVSTGGRDDMSIIQGCENSRAGSRLEVSASAIHGTRRHVVSNQGPVMKKLTDPCRDRVQYYTAYHYYTSYYYYAP